MTGPRDPEERAARRVVEAAESFYAAARAYGLNVEEARALHAPLRLRADAWCWRVDRDAEDWALILAAPLFSGARWLADPTGRSIHAAALRQRRTA